MSSKNIIGRQARPTSPGGFSKGKLRRRPSGHYNAHHEIKQAADKVLVAGQRTIIVR